MHFRDFIETINLTESNGFDSVNLFRAVALLAEGEQRLVQAALSFVVRHKLPVVIIGGTAVVHYLPSGRTLTPDIDFVTNDLPYIKTILDQYGLQHQPLAPFRENGVTIHGVQATDINADFLTAKGIYHYMFTTARLQNFAGVQVPFAIPEVLTIQKFMSGRAKDTDDAFMLLKSGNLDQEKYLGHVKKMESLRLLPPRGMGDSGDPAELENYAAVLT